MIQWFAKTTEFFRQDCQAGFFIPCLIFDTVPGLSNFKLNPGYGIIKGAVVDYRLFFRLRIRGYSWVIDICLG